MNRELTARDVVLFTTPALGLVLDYYCTGLDCSFQRVQIRDEQNTRARWAAGLWRGSVISEQGLPTVLASADRVVTVRRGSEDAGAALGTFGKSRPFVATRLPEHMSILEWKRGATSNLP